MTHAQYLVEIDRASYQYTLQAWPDTHPDSPFAKYSRQEWRAAIEWRDKRPDPEKAEMKEVLKNCLPRILMSLDAEEDSISWARLNDLVNAIYKYV